MAQHTPGPWGWDIQDYSMAILCANGDPVTQHVLSVTPCKSCEARAKDQGSKWEWGRCTTCNEANARLIAAAPELLEALRDMLAGWQYIRQVHGDLPGVGWNRAEIAAVAAIAKATGQ